MQSSLRYQISKSHGFCTDKEPLRYLPSLSSHIELAKNLSKLDFNKFHKLPELQNIETLKYEELEFSFLVHTFLISAYYWHSEFPNKIIPKNIAGPMIKLSKVLERPPILGLVSTQYHN